MLLLMTWRYLQGTIKLNMFGCSYPVPYGVNIYLALQ